MTTKNIKWPKNLGQTQRRVLTKAEVERKILPKLSKADQKMLDNLAKYLVAEMIKNPLFLAKS